MNTHDRRVGGVAAEREQLQHQNPAFQAHCRTTVNKRLIITKMTYDATENFREFSGVEDKLTSMSDKYNNKLQANRPAFAITL
jgi:hypothetical protein